MEASRLLKTNMIQNFKEHIDLDSEKEFINKKRKKGIESIPIDEFDNMASNILYIIKQLEKENKKVNQNAIIGKYIEREFDNFSSEDEVEEFCYTLIKVIKRLVEKEGIIYKKRAPNDKKNDIISINVNYEKLFFDKIND